MSETEFKKDGLRLRVMLDIDPGSPREWDNLGEMVCWHSKYNLGDDKPASSPEEFLEELELENGDMLVILPLYLYVHSGITMNTKGFACPWDSGQVGYIYADKKKLIAEFGQTEMTDDLREKVEKILKFEVEDYDLYLRGEVYGFILDMVEVCPCCGQETWEEIDSCWGFFGHDSLMENIGEHIPEEYQDILEEVNRK